MPISALQKLAEVYKTSEQQGPDQLGDVGGNQLCEILMLLPQRLHSSASAAQAQGHDSGTEYGFATARYLARTWFSGFSKPDGTIPAAILMSDSQVAEARQLRAWTDSASVAMTYVAIMTTMKCLTQVNMAILRKCWTGTHVVCQ